MINMQQRVMDRTDVVPVEALRDATTGLCQDIGQVVSVALGIGPDCDLHCANVPPSTSAENAAGLVTPALPSWLERPSVAQRRESLPSVVVLHLVSARVTRPGDRSWLTWRSSLRDRVPRVAM